MIGLQPFQHHSDCLLSLDGPELILVALIDTVFLSAATENVVIEIRTDLASLSGARLLIEAEVYPAVDPCIIDILSDLREFRVLKRYV